VKIFGNKFYGNTFCSSIDNLECTPKDRQIYPWGYMYPRLGTPALKGLQNNGCASAKTLSKCNADEINIMKEYDTKQKIYTEAKTTKKTRTHRQREMCRFILKKRANFSSLESIRKRCEKCQAINRFKLPFLIEKTI